MSWIDQTPIENATGLLKRQLEAALKRAGRVWNITQVMSLNPRVLGDSMRFYGSVMMGDSPLSRAQREMLGTVVSAELGCRY